MEKNTKTKQMPLFEGLPSTDHRPHRYFPEHCAFCRTIMEKHNGHGPSHNGSENCKSGSIASGGKNDHCTCDTCF